MTLTGNGASDGSYAQIGNGGLRSVGDASGAITVSITGSSGTTTLALAGGAFESYAMIGNGDAAQENNGNASGDVVIHNSGTTFVSDGSSALAWIGNITTNGTSSGNVALISAKDDSPNAEVGAFVAGDIVGGDVTVGETTPSGGRINDDLSYTSTHQLTVLEAGSLAFTANVENGGSGAINIVVGWDGSTGLSGATFTMANVLAAPGVAFGKNGAVMNTGGNEVVTASGPVTVAGPIVLTGDTIVDTTDFSYSPGADITFASAIDDPPGLAGSSGATLTAGTGTITFGGALGHTVPIGALTVNSANQVMLGGNITTQGGAVMFSSAPTVLTASVTIDTTASGAASDGAAVVFDGFSPVNSTDGTQSLTVNGGTNNVEFDADLGDTHPLKFFMASGGQFTAGGAITTSGGAVTVTTNPGINDGSDGYITLDGDIVTSGGALTLTATASSPYIDFHGNVSTGAGSVSVTATGSSYAEIDVYGNISTATGNVGLTANGSSGSNIYSSDYAGINVTSSGNITLSSSGGTNEAEIGFQNGASLETTSGAVTLLATGDSAYVYVSGPIQASGNVTVTADATGKSYLSYAEIDLESSEGGSISTTASNGSVTLAATSAMEDVDSTSTATSPPKAAP